MATKYKTSGSFKVDHNKITNLSFLHRILIQNKISSVTFFQSENSLTMCAMSYLTGLMIFYKVDFREFHEAQPTVQNAIPTAPILSIENAFDDLDITNIEELEQKREDPLRFSTSCKFVKALSQFSSNSSVDVTEDRLILFANNTILNFSVVQSMISEDDYNDEFTGIIWEKLNVPVVQSMASALSKTPDTLYKQFIALQEDKIFSHNASVILEANSWKLMYDYLLPYTALDIIRKIPKGADVSIGMKNKRLYLNIDGILISFEMLTDNMTINRAMAFLDKSNFVQMCEIPAKEWGKLNLLTTNGLSEEEDKSLNILEIELSTDSNCLIAKRDDDSIFISAYVHPGIKAKINLNLLHMAHKLCMTSNKSPEPRIYIDSTCTEKVMMFISDLTVIVRLSELHTDATVMANLPRLETKYNTATEGDSTDSKNIVESNLSKKDETPSLTPEEIKSVSLTASQPQQTIPQTQQAISQSVPESPDFKDIMDTINKTYNF